MTRSIHRSALVAAGFCLAAAGASAQQSGAHAGAAPWAVQAAAAVDPNVAVATYTGTFFLSFTIAVKSSIPTNFPIQCSATMTVTDIANGAFYSESKAGVATRTGNTATCSLTVPYAWSLSSGSLQVATNYMVSATSTGGSSFVSRFSSGALPSVTVPVNGTTLSRPVAVTI